MTLVLQTPVSVANAPLYRDFAALFTADIRVVGVWRLEDAYATFAGGNVTAFANMKAGGPPLNALFGNVASTIADPIIGRNVLHFDRTRASQYGVATDLSLYGGGAFTFFAAFRQLAYVSYDFSFMVRGAENTSVPFLRADRTGAPQLYPILTGIIGASARADLVVPDPFGWQGVTYSKDLNKGVTIEVRNGGKVTVATTIDNSATTQLQLGHAGTDRMPTANYALFALFNTDINLGNNADLKVMFEAFKREALAYR